jgi:hypothetical protein
MSGKAFHVGVTNVDEFEQSSLQPLIKHLEQDMSRPGLDRTARPSTKELASKRLILLFGAYTISILI